MSLWIRSQNKMSLSNGFTKIYAEENWSNSKYNINCVPLSKPGIITNLGNYSTREKALKVLDMIENHLIVKEEYRGGEFVLRPITPFIIPQDDEVDE